jgi:hypothetical protein
MPKAKLPEINLDTDPAKDLALKAITAHDAVATSEAEEKKLKKEIVDLCEQAREKEADKDNFIGLVRIVPKEESPVRCEFRMNGNGSLAVAEETNLNSLFGPSRPLLFERIKVVTAILDPSKVLSDLGPDAWDHVELRVKEDHDQIVISKSTAVSFEEALVAKKDFLNTLKDITHTLTNKAKVFIRSFLKQALSPAITVGGRGSSKT